MKRLKHITRFFGRVAPELGGNGLFASLDELIEQRQYVAYLRQLGQSKTFSSIAGDVKSAFKGRGMELEEIRSYTYGDDVRDIDWRVTARKEQPFTKLYAEERDREIYALLDLSPQMVFGTRHELKSVAAAKIAALLGWMSLENKDRFGCLVFDGAESLFFKPQNNRANMMVMLKKISETTRKILRGTAEKNSFAKALQLLQQNIKSQASVFVISDFSAFDDEVKKMLAALSRKARVYVLNVFDVLEELPPPAGEYMAENAGERVIFDSRSKYFQKEYKAYFKEKRRRIEIFCRQFGIRCVEIRTDIPLHKQLRIG